MLLEDGDAVLRPVEVRVQSAFAPLHLETKQIGVLHVALARQRRQERVIQDVLTEGALLLVGARGAVHAGDHPITEAIASLIPAEKFAAELGAPPEIAVDSCGIAGIVEPRAEQHDLPVLAVELAPLRNVLAGVDHLPRPSEVMIQQRCFRLRTAIKLEDVLAGVAHDVDVVLAHVFSPYSRTHSMRIPGPVRTDLLIRSHARSTKALALGVGWGDGGRNPVAIAMLAARGMRSALERLLPVGRPCFHTSGKKRLLDRNGRERRGLAAASPQLPDRGRNRMDAVANAERRVALWKVLRVHHASDCERQVGLGGHRARRPAW